MLHRMNYTARCASGGLATRALNGGQTRVEVETEPRLHRSFMERSTISARYQRLGFRVGSPTDLPWPVSRLDQRPAVASG
jgi:hypothetical protein